MQEAALAEDVQAVLGPLTFINGIAPDLRRHVQIYGATGER